MWGCFEMCTMCLAGPSLFQKVQNFVSFSICTLHMPLETIHGPWDRFPVVRLTVLIPSEADVTVA